MPMALIKTIVFWLFILLCLMILWGVVERETVSHSRMTIAYSSLITRVQNGEVLDAVIEGDQLCGHLKASPKDQFVTTLPPSYDDLERAMLAAGVSFSVRKPQHSPFALSLANLLPFALVAILAVPPLWVIFKKAGFQPILAVLVLVPLVNLLVLYVVAFSQWKSRPSQPA
jgi:ATP-dependent Zn protease